MKHKIKVRVAGPNFRKTKFAMMIEEGETIVLNADTPGLGLKHESTMGLSYVLYVDHGCVAIRNEAASKTLMVNQREAVQPTLNVGDILSFGGYSIQFLEVPMVGELNNAEEGKTQLIDPSVSRDWNAPAPTIFAPNSSQEPTNGALAIGNVKAAEAKAAEARAAEAKAAEAKAAEARAAEAKAAEAKAAEARAAEARAAEARAAEARAAEARAAEARAAEVKAAEAKAARAVKVAPEIKPGPDDFKDPIIVNRTKYVDPNSRSMARSELKGAPTRVGTGVYLKRRSNQLALLAVACVALLTFAMYFHTRQEASQVAAQLQAAKEKELEAMRVMESQKQELARVREFEKQKTTIGQTVSPVKAESDVRAEVEAKTQAEASAKADLALQKTVEVKAPADMRSLSKQKPAKSAKNKADADKFVHAAATGDVSYIKTYLNKFSGNISAKNKNGVPAIVSATKAGKMNAVKYLLSQGADVDSTDAKGMTALMWATVNQNPSVVTFLVIHGADRTIKNDDGKTAQDFATSGRSKDIAEMLTAPGSRSVASPKTKK